MIGWEGIGRSIVWYYIRRLVALEAFVIAVYFIFLFHGWIAFIIDMMIFNAVGILIFIIAFIIKVRNAGR